MKDVGKEPETPKGGDNDALSRLEIDVPLKCEGHEGKNANWTPRSMAVTRETMETRPESLKSGNGSALIDILLPQKFVIKQHMAPIQCLEVTVFHMAIWMKTVVMVI